MEGGDGSVFVHLQPRQGGDGERGRAHSAVNHLAHAQSAAAWTALIGWVCPCSGARATSAPRRPRSSASDVTSAGTTSGCGAAADTAAFWESERGRISDAADQDGQNDDVVDVDMILMIIARRR